MKYYLVLIVMSTAFYLSCNNDDSKARVSKKINDDVRPERERKRRVTNKGVRFYETLNGIKDGYDSLFDKNGQLIYAGRWRDGYKTGWFNFYSKGNLDKSVQYQRVYPISKSMVNQVISYDANGDTSVNNSFFYIIHCKDDTIGLGETFEFRVDLATPRCKRILIEIADFNEDFSLKNKANIDTLMLPKYGATIYLTDHVPGINTVRGRIVNFGVDPKDPKSMLQSATLYFNISYYVK